MSGRPSLRAPGRPTPPGRGVAAVLAVAAAATALSACGAGASSASPPLPQCVRVGDALAGSLVDDAADALSISITGVWAVPSGVTYAGGPWYYVAGVVGGGPPQFSGTAIWVASAAGVTGSTGTGTVYSLRDPAQRVSDHAALPAAAPFSEGDRAAGLAKQCAEQSGG